MMSNPVPRIELINAGKTYGGVYALRNVNFDLYPGEIHALVGENGAGKSTLCKALAGAIQFSEGEMRIDGVARKFSGPADSLRAGIAMVYQETSLVPTMTVAQNIKLGHENFLNRLRGLYISAQQILQSLNFRVDPTVNVSTLGAAQRQMVEIARAVYLKARIIIFDEPTATLTPEEKMHFFMLLEHLRRNGVATIFISHVLEEALEMSNRITVLRDGELVKTSPTSEMTREALIRHMVGRDLSQTLYSRSSARSSKNTARKREKILSVENIRKERMVKNMTFSIYSGEVTCIAGLVGSGRTEIAKIICGVLKRDLFHGGRIYLRDKLVRYRVPRQAINDGLCYITEDRKLNGFFETMTVDENIYTGSLATNFGWRFLIGKLLQTKVASEWKKRLEIRTLGNKSRVIQLSGGNQQKVVIAKSLIQNPKVVFFDEPTRGVDVGAIEQIHTLIRDLADRGLAVVVISSYLPEVLNLADRILVARDGRIVEEIDAAEATEEKVMYAAVH